MEFRIRDVLRGAAQVGRRIWMLKGAAAERG